MNVNLSETFENYIKAQLAAGTYNNASEVVLLGFGMVWIGGAIK